MLMEIFLGIFVFTAIILFLAAIILVARKKMLPEGDVTVNINDEKNLIVKPGIKLLQVLSDAEIFLPSACGGGGSCGQCKCRLLEGGGLALPVEEGHFNRKQLKDGWRLSCQVGVKEDLKIEVEPEFFGVKCWECEVISNDNVATFIKETVLKLPEGEDVNFRAGGYVQLEIPPYSVDFKNFEIQKEYHPDWDQFKIWDYQSNVDEITVRAYSMANYPEEKGLLKFNIRIATPPPGSDVPPGRMSSYVFDLKKGDKIKVFGPFGEFFVRETNNEMIYIGGGAGMAPLRSHVFDLLKSKESKRKISYWYGARSKREIFYEDEFEELARLNPNFSWNLALSSPMPEDNWTGYQGFIHQVLYDNYLKTHPNPEDCEYYLCGPPMMIDAVLEMLDSIGVESSNILFDDFGG